MRSWPRRWLRGISSIFAEAFPFSVSVIIWFFCLAEIYAARENNDIGISSSQLAKEIPGAIYCSTLDQVADTLARIARPDDLILTVGAGDIFRAGEKLLAKE